MSGWTTVPVRKETRDRLEVHPEKDGRDWDTFIRRELLDEDIDGSPDPVAVEELPMADFPTADVKEAVRAVIREEFPEGALR